MTISDINLEHLNMILTFLTSFSYSAFTNHCEEVLEPKKSTHVPEEKNTCDVYLVMSEASASPATKPNSFRSNLLRETSQGGIENGLLKLTKEGHLQSYK